MARRAGTWRRAAGAHSTSTPRTASSGYDGLPKAWYEEACTCGSTKPAALRFRQKFALVNEFAHGALACARLSAAVPSCHHAAAHLLGSVATHQLAAKADGDLCQTVVRRSIHRDREAVDEILHHGGAGPSAESFGPVVFCWSHIRAKHKARCSSSPVWHRSWTGARAAENLCHRRGVHRFLLHIMSKGQQNTGLDQQAHLSAQ